MILRSARKVAIVLLAIFVTASVSLSAVGASTMSYNMDKMAMSSDLNDHGDCPACPAANDDANASLVICEAVCLTPLIVLLSQFHSLSAVPTSIVFLSGQPILYGRAFTPDPYPPRSIIPG